jgi:hypothetical protein
MPKRERVPFTYDPALKVWERQPGEPKTAHLYFCMGLEMAPRQRSVKKVSEQAGVSALRCYQYSSEYDWTDRWREFDLTTFSGWFANLAADRMAVAYDFAEQLKVMMELSGTHLAQLREQPGALPPIEFTRLLNAGVAMFKTIYGAAPETVHHTGPGGGPLVTLDFAELDQLTPEEVAARVRQLTGQDLPPGLS